MTYSESPFSQLSDELWHVFGGRRRFPTTRVGCAPGASFQTYLLIPQQTKSNYPDSLLAWRSP